MKTNNYKLKELVTNVKYGPNMRSSLKGRYHFIMAKHFTRNSELIQPIRSFADESKTNDKHLLSDGDVLFAAKGTRNFAWTYSDNVGPAIASSTFLILKPNSDLTISKYLHHIINGRNMQRNIKSLAKGNTISSIPRKELMDIELAIPSIEEQKEIVKVLDTLSQEILLERKLMEKKIQLKKEITNHLLKNGLPTKN